MKIAIHTNAAWGGIVDYMVWQANAIAALGHEVVLLVPENFEKFAVAPEIEIRKVLLDLEYESTAPKFIRRIRWIVRTLKNWRITARETAHLEPDALLLSAFAEYLAPVWTRNFQKLRKRFPQLRIGTVVHDPVRRAFGPERFHLLSVRSAYEMLDVAFTHNPISLDQAGTSPLTPVSQIPFGVYDFPEAETASGEIRERLAISANKTILFAFGHIRDGKNLDLAIRLLPEFQKLHLVIAGKTISSRDQPVSFYENLARDLDVKNRLTILNRFIPEDEAADLFSAANFVLLSYECGFVSASSVLHVALKFRKPVLATSGDGHLKWAVEKYRLGVWTEPDSVESLTAGLTELIKSADTLEPRWEDYERENTWKENAQIVVEALRPNPVE
ncbi:MAG: glycosyltransferase [Verrucomicrobiota bacterium]